MALNTTYTPKKKNCLQNLALEAETVIMQLSTPDREVYRKLVAERINTLQQHNSPNHTHTHTPWSQDKRINTN